MRVSLKILIVAAASAFCFVTGTMSGGQIGSTSAAVVADPGVRGGPSGAGQALAGLPVGALKLFNNEGVSQFKQVESVDDGLGPRFNLDSCAGCHIFPAVGGSSPPTNKRPTAVETA